MTSRNYRGMILILKGRTSEINQADIGILEDRPRFSTCFLLVSHDLLVSLTLGPANLDSLDTNRIFSGFKSV
jgi:hypothetical protein